MDGPTRVAIVGDHRLLVDALCLVIQTQPDMVMVGTGATCTECLALVQQTHPRVLLLDALLPDGDGIWLAKEIRELSPGTHTLVLSALSDHETILRAMQAGVCGFLSTNRTLAEALRAIRQAASGETAISTNMLQALLNRTSEGQNALAYTKSSNHKNGRDHRLTQREHEVLTLLARGRSVDEIAGELVISPLTVRTHIRNLLKKLGTRTRLQAVAYALTHGLIEPLVS